MRVVSDGRGCAFRMFKHPLERVPYDSLVASTPPSNGRVTVNDNSQVVYTPRPGFVGEDMFVVDGVPHRSLTVRVIVRPPLPPSPDQPG
jgi:hypothetical protein